MNDYNRRVNCKNWYQGSYKKVLCLCSAGLLRSPTAAMVLSQAPYNYNTRAAGLAEEFALIPVDRVLLEWADEVVCVGGKEQGQQLTLLLEKYDVHVTVKCLNIPDSYAYRDPELIELIRTRYEEAQ